jgi:hypothetical protein
MAEFQKSAVEMALDLLKQGEAEFFAEPVKVEFASQKAEFYPPMAYAYSEFCPITATPYFEDSWHKLGTIRPVPIGEKISIKNRDEADSADPAIRSAGAPGSEARIAALAAWYALSGDNERSPFMLSDNAIAEHLAQLAGMSNVDARIVARWVDSSEENFDKSLNETIFRPLDD